MNSISKAQFAVLLIITDLFGLFCCRGDISMMTMWGYLAGVALQFLFGMIFAVRGGALGRKAGYFYLLYAVFCGGTLFAELWQTSGVIYIPYESSHEIWGKLMTAGLIAIVCLYSSSTGIRPVARVAVIVGAVGALCIATDFVSALLNADWHNVILPKKRGYAHELMRGFAYSGGLGSFAVLLENVRGDKARAVVGYYCAKAAAAAVVLLTALAVSGGIMSVSDFPVITAAQLSQPFDAQRIDSLFLVVFAVFAVYSVTLQVMTGAHLLKKLFPHFEHWRSTAVIIATVLTAVMLPSHPLLRVRAFAAIAAMIFAPLGAKKTAA